MKEKLIVIGWGRMGVTHASIINGLFPNRFEIEILDPNWKVRLITKATFGYKVVKTLNELDFKNSRVLITTPPTVHKYLAEFALQNGANSVFVEKPFGLHDKRVENDFRISAGYVLRFTEVAQKLKRIIEDRGCKEILIEYSSNTLIKPPTGWRNSVYGGVLNEMGSHLIDLLVYFLGDSELNIHSVEIKSLISDVDDYVRIEGTYGGVDLKLNLNWADKRFRKPVWSGKIKVSDNSFISFDQQSIENGFEQNPVDYYVRGREFSLQMKHFIDREKSIACNSVDANKVHDLITKIKQSI